MLHTRRIKTRSGISVSAALALLLLPLLLAPNVAQPRAVAAHAAEGASPGPPPVPAGESYRQTNLMSEIPGLAPIRDPRLVNPWGLAVAISGGMWIADHATNAATIFEGDFTPLAFLTSFHGTAPESVPGGPPAGVVSLGATGGFRLSSGSSTHPARFAFASTNGAIMGWSDFVPTPASSAAVVTASRPGHVYTGLAFNHNQGSSFLYAPDFAGGKIDVFDDAWAPATVQGDFADPTVPADFHPFNVESVGASLYVTYAREGAGGEPGAGGGGYVRKFDGNGVRDPAFAVDGGALDAPWGLALAPPSFGVFGGALLVGNYGDGRINAYDPSTGAALGQLRKMPPLSVEIERLRALRFGGGGFTDPNKLYFTSSIGEERRGLFGSLEATAEATTSSIQFSADEYAIGEGSGHIDITVTRSGDASGAAAVNFNTFDQSQPGHASQKGDYEIALGALSFAPGETSKTFRVLVIDDGLAEGAEAVNLALSNPTGAGVGLGGPNFAALAVNDNDPLPAEANPVDSSEFFVRQHYLDFLNREPDAPGLAFWTNEIESCGADARCREVRRVNVSAAFFLSIEFQSTGLLAYLSHKAVYGSRPPYWLFERDVQRLQKDYAFGQPGAEARLEANKAAYFDEFVRRPELGQMYPPGTYTPERYVADLYSNIGVTPSEAERAAAIAEFGGASNIADAGARARVLRRVAEHGSAQERNPAFVLMEYFGYLRRDADAPGFDFWLDKLNGAGGDFQAAEMVKAFISSAEYRQRFGP